MMKGLRKMLDSHRIRICPILQHQTVNSINRQSTKMCNSIVILNYHTNCNHFMSSLRSIGTVSSGKEDSVLCSSTTNDIKKSDNQIDQLVNSCIDLSDLITTLEPYLSTLSVKQLGPIYDRINQLYFKARDKSNSNNQYYFSNEFLNLLNQSTFLQHLFKRTLQLVKQLSDFDLLQILFTFRVLQLDPRKNIVINVIDTLHSRLNQMSSKNMIKLAITFTQYSRAPKVRFPKTYASFSGLLSDLINKKVNNNELNNDAELMIQFLHFFFLIRQYNQVVRLTERLLSSDCQINYKDSLQFLYSLKQAKLNDHQNDLQSSKILTDMIQKCNDTIYKHLITNVPNEIDRWNLCYKMHGASDSNLNRLASLTNLYDPRILTLIMSGLIDTKNDQKIQRRNYIIYQTMQNYAVFRIYDQRILRYIYEQMLQNEKLRRRRGINFFNLSSNYPVPFIDYSHLAELLYNDDSYQIKNFIENNGWLGLQLLLRFILFDVNDQILLDCSTHLRPPVDRIIDSDFEKLSLVQVYFSLFRTECKSETKFELIDRLEKFQTQLLTEFRKRVKVRKDSFADDKKQQKKLQLNVYHSNGLLLRRIGIYDHSTKDLVPIDQFEAYFDEIDLLPLNDNQELFAILSTNRIRGHIGQYESIYNQKLKRVLNQLKIKSISVFYEDIANLSNKERDEFRVRKAIESFN